MAIDRRDFLVGLPTGVLAAWEGANLSPFRRAANASTTAESDPGAVTIERGATTIAFEAYAPNIIRITMSRSRQEALAPPGYGVSAHPSARGWTYRNTPAGDVYTSSRLNITVPPPAKHAPVRPSQEPIARFFNSTGAARYPDPPVILRTAEGKSLLTMESWFMEPPSCERGNTELRMDRRPQDKPFFQVGATFASPADEHYYGLGQNQQGHLDHRGREVLCWADYQAAGGESFSVPFLVTNRGYGIVWDNPSKTTVTPGFNEQTRWVSQVGNRVSYFVIAGRSTDEIYEGYRLLTGPVPMLPRYAYGFVQSKNRYGSQAEVLQVARGYRERHLPLDVVVVDWFYFTKMGQMDFVPADWPDPAEMNRELNAMHVHSMISVWPRFTPGSRYYDLLRESGWFMHRADGTPTTTNGLPGNQTGSNIDTTNPAAARWFWNAIRDNLIAKGFSAIWTDETEPDIPPNGSYFHIGPGTRYFNVYPLFHTAAVYEGMRRDTKTRALILARAAYLGAHRNGTIFWSSDISPTWDAFRRQVPTGLGVTASGLPYWCNDVGGFLPLPAHHHPLHPPLIDPSDARDNVGGYDDYPELYVRWFEYGTFLPILRTHGTRRHNEVWSYGRQAQPILEKYLRLRYALIPYIYSLAHRAHETGAPYMRALFMDFPDDPKVLRITDEYMFGPAFLVAPVTAQGATARRVYLPAGSDWYNFWTSERLHGGQTVTVSAPIDTLPLFVRSGSIIPLAEPAENAEAQRNLQEVRVYAGADAEFELYHDDGTTYAYETGEYKITRFHWNDSAHHFEKHGEPAWTAPDAQIVKIIGDRS